MTSATMRTHHARTRARVGEYFNHLGARIVGGGVNGGVYDNSHPHFADFSNREIGLFGESKASDNRHHWRLSLGQKNRYVDARPLINYVYFLPSYRSQRREKRKNGKWVGYSPLARIRSKAEQIRFWAEFTDEVYLFDLEFVQALADAGIGNTEEANSFGYREDSLVHELQRNQIRPFRLPSEETLRSLGLPFRKWTFRKYEMELRYSYSPKTTNSSYRSVEYSVRTKFPLYTVLSSELDRLLSPIINRQNDAGLPF